MNHYELLNVSQEATLAQIKKAFKTKALTCHPDLHPGQPDKEELFKKLAEAYQTLENNESRKQYDLSLLQVSSSRSFKDHETTKTHQHSHSKKESHFQQSEKTRNKSKIPDEIRAEETAKSFAEMFKDIFADVFSAQPKKQISHHALMNTARTGCDLKILLHVNEEELKKAVKKNISYERRISCRSCQGFGNLLREPMKTCATCQGRGTLKFSDEQFELRRNCPACHGIGKTHPKLCNNCQGLGVEQTQTSLMLNLEDFKSDPDRLFKIVHKGDFSIQSRTYGDLFIRLKVNVQEAHHRYEEKGNVVDEVLQEVVSAPFMLYFFGGELQIEVLDQTIWLKIPAMLQPEQKLRIKLKKKNKDFEVYFKINWVLPENLSSEQIKALQYLKNNFQLSQFNGIKNFKF